MPAPVTASVADLRTGQPCQISRASAAIASLLGSIRLNTLPAVSWGRDEIVWTDSRLRENTLRANRYGFVLHRRRRTGAADDNILRGVPQNHPAAPVIENAVASLCDALSHGRPVHTWHQDYGLESIVTWTDEYGQQPGISCHGGRIHTKPTVLWRPHVTDTEGHLNTVYNGNRPAPANGCAPPPPEGAQTSAETHRRAMELATQAFMARMTATPEESVPLFEQALKLEMAAIRQINSSVEPSWSVLHRSARWMAVHCRQYDTAASLANQALAGDPPADIRAELHTLLDAARRR